MKSKSPDTAARAINYLLPEFPIVATITTSTTGNPGVSGINPLLIKTLRNFKYKTEVSDSDQEFDSLTDIEIATRDSKSTYDLLFLDSWHTYEDSLKILEIGIQIAKPNSIILVHDCLSRSSSLSPSFVAGAWSGVTCFVFREFVKTINREWFVLDSDHGLGVIGPEVESKKKVQNSVDLELLRKAENENFEKFHANPSKFMRGVSPANFHLAIDLVKSGLSPEALADKPKHLAERLISKRLWD